jgi:hypothetical protein
MPALQAQNREFKHQFNQKKSIMILDLFNMEYYILWAYHGLFIYSPADGY